MNEKAVTISSLVYKLAAISNFLVTLPAFIVYDFYVSLMTPVPPTYPFLIWIWCGMAFLWGVMFWEISTDVFAKQSLIKYSYLEKAITSSCVLIAFLTANVPLSFLVMIIFTDIVWIPVFVTIHWKVHSLKVEKQQT